MARSTYVLCSHGHDCWEDEDSRDKCGPSDCPEINSVAPRAHPVRSRSDLAGDHLADNRDTVRPVERNSGDIEDGGNRGVATKTNQIEQDGAHTSKPNGVDWRLCQRRDLVPDAATWEQLVTSKGEDGATARLQRSDTGEVEDDKREDSE